MGGIVAIMNLDGAPVGRDALAAMTAAAHHRGPDGQSYWIDGAIGLAHLALRATPQSAAECQPRWFPNAAVRVVADARLDDRDALVRGMADSGFVTGPDPTDAELILAAYCRWGEAAPEHLIGDFAFAIWDARAGRLFCARDPLGVKRLHYGRNGAVVCVASEAQQILHYPAFPRQLHELALASYLVGDFADDAITMFAGIHRLPAGHWLSVTRDGLQSARYWDIDPASRVHYRCDEDYAAHFRDVFRLAVRDRLRATGDAVGVYLSGGLDSGSVAAVAQQEIAGHGCPRRIVAISLAYDDVPECDERAYSGAMAAELGLEVEHVVADQDPALDLSGAVRPSLEAPPLGMEAANQRVLNMLRERGVRVVLTGHGGDSVVRGNTNVYRERLLRGDVRVLREMVEHSRLRGVAFHRLFDVYIVRPLVPRPLLLAARRLVRRPEPQAVPNWLRPEVVRKWDLAARLARPLVSRRFRGAARQENYQRATVLAGVGLALDWHERSAAHFGMEARHPFLDRRLVEYILSVPPEQLFRAGRRKVILREAMRGVLPDVVRLRRGKTSLAALNDLTLTELVAGRVDRLFADPLLSALGIVDAARLRQEYARCRADGRSDDDGALWRTVALEFWVREVCQAAGLVPD